MKSVNIGIVAVMVAIFTLAGCSTRLIEFTVISSKNVNLRIDRAQGKFVSASSNGLFGLGANIKDAMDKALTSAGPNYDLLVDGVVRVNDYILVNGYTVEGTAINTSSLKASLGTKGFEDWCKAQNIFDPNTAKVKSN